MDTVKTLSDLSLAKDWLPGEIAHTVSRMEHNRVAKVGRIAKAAGEREIANGCAVGVGIVRCKPGVVGVLVGVPVMAPNERGVVA